MDDEDDIPAPLDALTDALVGSGVVIGQIIGHMLHSQAITGREEPPVEAALYEVLYGVLEPMAEHREFELGVAARVLHDALHLVMTEVHLMPIDEPRAGPPARRTRRRRG
jgi:hypothetical protein